MFFLPPTVRVFICTQPADMRKGFDGLSALAKTVMSQDPLSGNFFVFRNKRGDKLKILYWGGDGLCLWYKRLESGTFELTVGEGGTVEITSAELAMIIEGINLQRNPRRKRYAPPTAQPA